MTEKQLEKGQRILKEIRSLYEAINRWENLTEIRCIIIQSYDTSGFPQEFEEREILNYIDISRFQKEIVSNLKIKLKNYKKNLIISKVMNEVKTQIPDNCELIKDEGTYIVKEKKQTPPRSWEEFCERCPKKIGNAFISSISEIHVYSLPSIRDEKRDKNVCSSEEEAEAFLALMQLRQLRKAWVGNWEPSGDVYYAIVCEIEDGLKIGPYEKLNKSLSFLTQSMAYDFFSCFRGLCETAKTLL